MPTYDYRCEANGQVYEVRHPMALRPKTWGELRAACALAEDVSIPDDAPVTRLMTAAGVVNSRVLKNPEAPACARGGCAGNCRWAIAAFDREPLAASRGRVDGR